MNGEKGPGQRKRPHTTSTQPLSLHFQFALFGDTICILGVIYNACYEYCF